MPKKLVKKKKLVGSKKSVRSREARQQLQNVHDRRSPIAQQTDEALLAEIAPTRGHWLKNPNEWDVPGVDTPIDWRTLDEKEKLKMLQAGELKSPMSGDMRLDIAEVRYRWQKKNPFISAQLYSGDRETLDGLEQHKWAVGSGEDFGFDLRRPQTSFLDRYGMKKHDIKGLRVMLVPTLSPSMRGASGFYVSGNKTLVLPPVSPMRKRSGTIYHEVGHHISGSSKALRSDWSNDEIVLTRVSGRKTTAKAEEKEAVTMATAICNQWRYFDGLPQADIENWREAYVGLGMGGPRLNALLDDEAFAETFRVYRGGELKKELKWQRLLLEQRHNDEEYCRKQYEKAKAVPKSKRTEYEEHNFKKRQSELTKADRRLKAQGAIVDNYMTIINWMKKYDAKGWGIVEERPTKAQVLRSFDIQTIPKKSLMIAEADTKILKKSTKEREALKGGKRK